MSEQFSADEKLRLVAAGQMDPKEIGLVSEEEAKNKLIENMTPEQQLAATKLGNFLVFEASEVPTLLRAQWALKDLAVAIPKSEQADYLENWQATHKDEHLIQARFQCGTVAGVMEQKASDTVLGFAEILKKLAIAIQKRYEEQLQLEEKIAQDSDAGEQPDSVEKIG